MIDPPGIAERTHRMHPDQRAVAVLGPHGSGTSWHFQIVKTLLAGEPDARWLAQHCSTPTRRPFPNCDAYVYVQRRADLVAMANERRGFGPPPFWTQTLWQGRAQAADCFRILERPVLDVWYADTVADLTGTVARIAAFLDLTNADAADLTDVAARDADAKYTPAGWTR